MTKNGVIHITSSDLDDVNSLFALGFHDFYLANSVKRVGFPYDVRSNAFQHVLALRCNL